MRKLAVSTNWPTVIPKPERKALYGYKVDVSANLVFDERRIEEQEEEMES
jgi:hypothetical protein